MKRILVVEDEPGIAFGLQRICRRRVTRWRSRPTGRPRSSARSEEPFDLILLDVMLPRKDGFEVCRELRRAGVRTPIILLTARAQEAEKVMGLELGADDYVTKPFSPRELRARIKAALRRADGEDAGSLSLRRRWRWTSAAASCAARGKPVENDARWSSSCWPPSCATAGRLLNRAQLLDLVWGPGTFVTDRVVDNHVVTLRKKIEPDPTRPRYLLNVRGLGYRFDA